MSESVIATYKGTSYNISHFIQSHPGGAEVIKDYLKMNANIT